MSNQQPNPTSPVLLVTAHTQPGPIPGDLGSKRDEHPFISDDVASIVTTHRSTSTRTPMLDTVQMGHVANPMPISNVDLELGLNNTSEKQRKNSAELDRQYDSLIKRFNMKVTLSTFACTLIVTYYSLVNAIVINLGRRHIGHSVPYNVGLLLSFIAIAFHAGSAILAGRSAVLCSDPDLKKAHPSDAYFTNILATCEHLDLDGTIVFVLAVFESSFLLFDSYIYPGVFCAVSVVLLLVLFLGKYRELSLVYKDFMLVKGWVVNWFSHETRS